MRSKDSLIASLLCVWCSLCISAVICARETQRPFLSAEESTGDSSRRHQRSRTQDDHIAQVFQRPQSSAPQSISPRERGTSPTCDISQVEHRLTRIEGVLNDKAENLRSELLEGERRLQNLEWESSNIQRSLESIKDNMREYTGVPIDKEHVQRDTSAVGDESEILANLEGRIDSLARGVQLAVVALKGLNNDVKTIRSNISYISDTTSEILRVQNIMLTKGFLDDDMMSAVFKNPSNLGKGGKVWASNCNELKQQGKPSGIYTIQPNSSPEPMMVLCEMDTRGGGWLYVQNRYDGTQDFYLDWSDYKQGFGNLGGEFWLGLEHLYHITGQEVHELLIELADHESVRKYARYSAFSVGSEAEGYRLKVLAGYQGDAGDSLSYHAGQKFSTKDEDHDEWIEGSCAQSHGGAWWYKSCDNSNLNGKYLNGAVPPEFIYQGMYWAGFRGPEHSLTQARIMIRPISAQGTTFHPTARPEPAGS